jgi:hypothetical protein
MRCCDTGPSGIQHLLFLLFLALILLGGSSSTLALNTARSSTTIRRSESKVDVLLGVETDDE